VAYGLDRAGIVSIIQGAGKPASQLMYEGHPWRDTTFKGYEYNALLTVLKKIDFDLSMLRVASRRHIFEAHVNGFTLVLQVHGAKPFDDLAQQASVRLG